LDFYEIIPNFKNFKCAFYGLPMKRPFSPTASLAVALIALSFVSLRAASPLDDAIGLWHFSDTANSADPGVPLGVEGDVRLGVALDESGVVNSRLRGGDGAVADFSQGGWLNAGLGTNNALDVKGRELTYYLRLRDPSGTWNAPILSRQIDGEKTVHKIVATDSYLRGLVGTTNNRVPMFGDAPFNEMRDELARTAWHDVVLRLDGVKLQMFVDGRLYDEDFMLGDLLEGAHPLLFGAEFDENGEIRAGFRGQIDTAALWNRPLTDAEVLFLSGGPHLADQRQVTDLGDGATPQYWIPPNHYNVGDCMPFYADGVFHFMFLLDKGHHGARNGLGGHQWIQMTSKDLVHWTHHPFLFEFENQEEGSFCTGSVFHHDGTYYAYYSNRGYEFPGGDYNARWIMHGRLAMAVSKDGIHFKKTYVEPLIDLPEDYAHTTRDPVVFRNPETNQFHMYFTTTYKGYGCWGQAISDDLYHWELAEPIFAHRDGEPECPDWFRWGDKYYTIANHTNGYWLWSDSPNGPWDLPPAPNQLMPGIINVPKTAPFGENRRIICGWTREAGFGGHSVIHELVRHEDGTLGEKFVPELIPAVEPPIFRIENLDTEYREWPVSQPNLQIKFHLTFPAQRRDRIRDLRFQFADDALLVVSPRAGRITLGEFNLSQVDFTTGELELTLILKGKIADLEVNGNRTLTSTFSEVNERRLVLHGDGPGWNVERFEVSPLKQK
jgi:sucrose-6-phosphate hydrolase SacC (GH32 family)